MLNKLLSAVPGILAAGLIMAIAYFVADVVGGILTKLMHSLGVDDAAARFGYATEDDSEHPTPSVLAGKLTVALILAFAAIESARRLGFDTLADLIARFTVFAGQIALGVVVMIAGIYFAKLAVGAIRASGTREAELLASAARVAILLLAGAMALRQMGLANEIIQLAFGLLLGSVAVAVAIAGGLGARPIVEERLRAWIESRLSPDAKA